jgi:ornithine carbamoyltransferase
MKRDFLSISDFSRAEIEDLLDVAVNLKKEWFAGGNEPVLKNKVMAMIFQKPSLRTRVSFDMAMRHLGGDALYLSPMEIGLGKKVTLISSWPGYSSTSMSLNWPSMHRSQ